jgi:hypothetical protein
MEPELMESLHRILDYLHDDEIKDWDESGCPSDHIYIDVRRLMNWLGEQPD